jgi:hypothetical protein
MKLKLIASFFIASLSLSAQQITGFGNSSDFTLTYSTFIANTGAATSYTVTGPDNGSFLVGSFNAPISLGTPSALVLSATQSTALSSSFTIELLDSVGNSAVYSGNWAQFSAAVPTSSILTFSNYTGLGAFNGTASSLVLSTGGIGSELTVSLNNLAVSAVPEPATYAALFGLGVLGLAVYRRHRPVA